MKLRSHLTVAAVSLLGALAPQAAQAVPALQLYIDGASYDSASETWVFSGAGSFQLWVIGNITGPGGAGPISNVKLSAAVATSGSGSIMLTPTTTSTLTDPSTPSAPGALPLSADGAVPVMGNGSLLPAHGIYGAGTSFFEWTLGNFTLSDSPIADFINSYPTTFTANAGQINVYDVAVTGYTTVHFDTYDTIIRGANHAAKFAPFSHDAGVSPIPEPQTYAMLLAGLGLMGFVVRRRQHALAA